MPITQTTNHNTQALNNLLSQFRNKPNLAAVLNAFMDEVQELETVLFQILTETVLGVAVGVQLDGLGEIVGEAREGRSDADYAVGISAHILLNKSNGTIEDLIALVLAMVGGGVSLEFLEDYPAGFVITADDLITVDGELVSSFIIRGKPAGVASHFRWFEDTPEFRFDTAGNGFDDGKMGGSVTS